MIYLYKTDKVIFVMQEENLYQKYFNGRHWESHPTIYAESFIEFLKSQNFKGLVVDIGCG